MKKIVFYVWLFVSISMYVAPLCASEKSNKTHLATKQHIKRILLVVAMDTEALPIVNALHLNKSSHKFSSLPMQGYAGKYNNFDVFLISNGKDPIYTVQNVGTQAATLTTYLGIQYFHPDFIISIGTAGGIAEKGAAIGDVYMSQKIYFYDRRIPTPNYKEYGMGGYESANLTEIAKLLNLKSGTVCSGDSFDDDQTDKDIILKYGCSAKEMEAAGVAWVSMLTQTPMIAIKGITDIVGSPAGHEDFEKHLAEVTKKLSEKISDILNLMSADVHPT